MANSILKQLSKAVAPLANNRYIFVAAEISALSVSTVPFEVSLKPLARKFRLDNPHINYPYLPEHVPVPLLAFIASVMPLAIISFPGFASGRYRKHSIISILGFLLSITATMFVSDVFKWAIGNQRPDFIARCQPKPGVTSDQYVTVEAVCTNPDMATVWEGCRSTPSGHSSLSFASFGFLSIWIFLTFDSANKNRPIYMKLAAVLPLLLGAYVAYTRIIDHKHHWFDVISGSILGAVIAFFSYTHVVAESKPEKPEFDSATALA